jgi:hypothetical protein
MAAPIAPPSSPTPSVGLDSPMPPAVQLPKKRGRFGLVGTFVAVAAAAIGAIVVKFVLPLLLVGAVGQVLGSAFGGPYGRLPSDVRSGFDNRLEAAVGSSMDGESDSDKSDHILTLVKSGLSRLDDGLITTNFQLTSKALGAVDVPSCAAISRAIISGAQPPEDATNAMINTLSDSDLKEWFEIRVSALEAESRNSPAQVAVTDDQVNPLYTKLFALMQPEDITVIGQLGQGGTVEDAPLCTAIRDLYSSVGSLSPSDALLFARYDVSP